MKEKIILLASFFVIISTYLLFQLDQDLQNLYERKNTLDIKYAEFLGLHLLTQTNPVQSLSDEYFRLAYSNYYFSIYEKNPTPEVLSEITSHYTYGNYLKELFEVPETDKVKNKILNELKNKQIQQMIFFWLLIMSSSIILIIGFSSIKSEKKDKMV